MNLTPLSLKGGLLTASFIFLAHWTFGQAGNDPGKNRASSLPVTYISNVTAAVSSIDHRNLSIGGKTPFILKKSSGAIR